MSFLFSVIYLFRIWGYGVCITYKGSDITDAGIFPYHAKLGELLSNALWSFRIYTYYDVSAVHHNFFHVD